MMVSKSSPWIVRRVPRPHAGLRLFCFPHAGAGSAIFHDWHASFPANIEVCAIEPPGRLTRHNEPALRDMPALVQAMRPVLESFLDRPFAFFGYSLGALMAFECTRTLRRDTGRNPAHLIVAASKAPQLPRRHASIAGEPDPVFLRELERRYGPFEPAIKAEPELLKMILDGMRADLSMLETYRYEAEPSLTCPLLAIGGSDDASVTRLELEGWSTHTSAAFRCEWLQGGHFFLRNSGPELRALVTTQLLS